MGRGEVRKLKSEKVRKRKQLTGMKGMKETRAKAGARDGTDFTDKSKGESI